jgi:hypothetical protein
MNEAPPSEGEHKLLSGSASQGETCSQIVPQRTRFTSRTAPRAALVAIAA